MSNYPYPNLQQNAAAAIPVYVANGNYIITPPTPFPATIAGNTTWSSGVILAGNADSIVACATLSQSGDLIVSRYLDAAGTILIDTNNSGMTAATPTTVKLSDFTPFLSFVVSIQNTSGSTGTLSNAGILVG
jgi:hypothetical protein